MLFIYFLLITSTYLLTSNNNYRKVFGIVLLSTVINLSILIFGRGGVYPAFLPLNNGLENISNPLSQALILTAIVISLGFFAIFASILKNISAKSCDEND